MRWEHWRAVQGTRCRYSFVASLLVGILALVYWRDLAAADSYLERLRELEKATMRVIEMSKRAFVFIGGGSGFCISEDGYILTNDHVVIGEKRPLRVFFSGGKMYEADVIGRDLQGDVALLKVRGAKNLPHLELGDSSKLRVGQRVVALGDPFLLASESIFMRRVPPDYEPSASSGIISALHRYSDTYSDAIQVDLAVNRGNSGGPLLTLDGEVVGINGKIETRFALGINTGVGYAIPSRQVLRFLKPLKSAGGGEVFHGTIRGLQVAERVKDRIGLPVTRVVEDSAADRAGFAEGDLVLTLAGLPVTTSTRFRGILASYPAGEEIAVRIARGEKVLEIAAVLLAPGGPFLGVSTVGAEGDVTGALITRVVPGSPADRAGLESDDVITAFAGKSVSSPTDLAGLIGQKRAGDPVAITVHRDNRNIEMRLRLGSKPD